MDKMTEPYPGDKGTEPDPDRQLVQGGDILPGHTHAIPRPGVSGKKLKIQMLFIVLSLCILQAAAGWWIYQWKSQQDDLQARLRNIHGEISDLRNLMQTNIDEELISLKILVLNPDVTSEAARQIAAAVYKYARIYHRDPDLILAMMSVESDFDPRVESHMGAIGLMQIMPHWIGVLDIQCDLKTPDCNTKYGLQILGAYEHLYEGLDMALTAYNRGPGPVDAALMRKRDPHNGYAEKVRSVYSRLRSMNRNGGVAHENTLDKVVTATK